MNTDEQTTEVKYALDEYLYGGLPITSDDVETVVRYGDYYQSINYRVESALAAVVRLKDGRYAAIEGGYGCETGWSCQASLTATIHATEQEAWVNVTQEGRALMMRQVTS